MTHTLEAPARGRPCADNLPHNRLRRMRVLYARRHANWSEKMAAHIFGCSRRSVNNWCESAARYPEAASAETLRAAADWDRLMDSFAGRTSSAA